MSDYVVLKLITDELVIAELLADTRVGTVLSNPVKIVSTYIQSDGGMIQQTSTAPYCRLTIEKEFTFNPNNIIFIKPLHPALVPFYKKLVMAFETDEDQSTDDEPSEEVMMASKSLTDKMH